MDAGASKSGPGPKAQVSDVERIRSAMSSSKNSESDLAAVQVDQGGEAEERQGGDDHEDTTIDLRPISKGKLKNAILACDWKEVWRLQDKGTISNMITFVIMIIGIAGALSAPNDITWLCIRAIGLFGFSGGITNWMAIKMLFDRVPFLIGSGVITKQFKEIRQTVMDTVLETFFDSAFLGQYIADKAALLEQSDYLRLKIATVLADDEVDALLLKHLEALMLKPEGMMLAMIGMNAESMRPLVRPMVLALDVEIAPMITSQFDPSKMIDTKAIRGQVKELMRTKMEMLTPEMVKALVEEMIRTHLGWLVVWGNLFGGLIGVVCQLATWDGTSGSSTA
eukprot:m.154481 g.154481  ORF g.154481 m.154481 type:complete len:338 (+) comp23510_c0_seq1:53-1066(+)